MYVRINVLWGCVVYCTHPYLMDDLRAVSTCQFLGHLLLPLGDLLITLFFLLCQLIPNRAVLRFCFDWAF